MNKHLTEPVFACALSHRLDARKLNIKFSVNGFGISFVCMFKQI